VQEKGGDIAEMRERYRVINTTLQQEMNEKPKHFTQNY
jgi:hypothetical protein